MQVDVRPTVLVTIIMELHELSTAKDLIDLGIRAVGHEPTEQAKHVLASFNSAYTLASKVGEE